MKKNISPWERAMQILSEIETGEPVSTAIFNRKTANSRKEEAVERTTASDEEGPVEGYVSIQPSSPHVKEEKVDDTVSQAISLDSENILKGIIYSEILSKPKALRRGRWY